jgi:endogenous inhibitor of DNA gyrase (YacG/DUF329 family)
MAARKDSGGADELTGRPCPICGKPGLAAYRPFCSKRCADVDLGRWLSGVYAIPAAPDSVEDDEGIDEEIPQEKERRGPRG